MDKIKVALDASVVIDLFTLVHPRNDKDGKVMKALEHGTLFASDWEHIDYAHKPDLLKDDRFSFYKNNKYYNLENTYQLLQLILQGKVEVCVTPTTFQALTGLNSVELDFLENHITPLVITNKDFGKTYGTIIDLVFAYKKAYNQLIPRSRFNSFTTHKAYVVAEASMAGLPLITDDRSLIHCSMKNEYEMSKLIKQVNHDFTETELPIKTVAGNLMSTTTLSVAMLLKNLQDEKMYLYPDIESLRIEDNEITL
ncbi:MAG: hypothetical protein ACLRFE_00875 [Clostridia bacterium]